jgi:hypothetical protein
MDRLVLFQRRRGHDGGVRRLRTADRRGKLFTVLYIVVGISLIATFLDARFKKAASRIAARDDR